MRRSRSLATAAAAGLALAVSACIPDVVPDLLTLPRCDQVKSTCGPAGNESCCAVGLVAGGDFARTNDTTFPAHVSEFTLDRFEVTVGRFRQFLGGYPRNKPAKGAGVHPRIPGSGWDPAWDAHLPADQAALTKVVTGVSGGAGCLKSFATWTDTPGADEDLPINCVSWYVAFAFCAWDGGRLSTESEWNFAAAGGKLKRPYPWGAPSVQTVGVLFNCPTSLGMCLLKVGASSPASDGVYGQADLAGNLAEWNLDYQAMFVTPCTDCAGLIDAGNGREARGGDFAHGTDAEMTSNRIGYTPELPVDNLGIRCARDH